MEEREKTLFRFVVKVNEDCAGIGQDDLAQVKAAGWDDEQIYYAITVCALFNFYNRWVDAAGIHPLSDADHQEGAERSAVQGYVRK